MLMGASEVRVSIDLGAPRIVDEVTIFWGDIEPRPAPKQWELRCGLAGDARDGVAAPSECIATMKSTLKEEEWAQLAAARASGELPLQAHKLNVDCSAVKLSPPKRLQVLELRLKVPHPLADTGARIDYSIRQIQVLGPGLARAAGETGAVAKELSGSSTPPMSHEITSQADLSLADGRRPSEGSDLADYIEGTEKPRRGSVKDLMKTFGHVVSARFSQGDEAEEPEPAPRRSSVKDLVKYYLNYD